MKCVYLVTAFFVTAAIAVAAEYADPPRTPDRPLPGQPSAERPATPPGIAAPAPQRVSDAEIAQWLIPGNQEEVALGRLAQQQSQNDAVKDFAQRMVDDHSKMLTQLQQVAGGQAPGRHGHSEGALSPSGTERPTAPRPDARGGAGPGLTPGAAAPSAGVADPTTRAGGPGGARAADRPSASTDDPTTGAGAGGTPGGTALPPATARGTALPPATTGGTPMAGGQHIGLAPGETSPWVQIHQQIKQQCLAMTQRELKEKRGAEFDKCYIGQQIVGHVDMLANLEVLDDMASPQFKTSLTDARRHVQEHLDLAKQIMQQLDRGATGARSVERPDTERR